MSDSESKAETLVVVSKVKKFIKDQSGFATGKCFIEAITEKVMNECNSAIESTKQSGRKTVMGRDLVSQ